MKFLTFIQDKPERSDSRGLTAMLSDIATRFHRISFRCKPNVIVVTAVVALINCSTLWAASSVIGAGDVVRITVYGQPDLNTDARVGYGGNITFPLLGQLKIGQLTPTEAEQKIAAALSDGGFVKNANVNLFVEEKSAALAASATILGQVTRSGKYALRDDVSDGARSLIDLLALAGGVKNEAADHLFLVRNDEGKLSRTRVDLVELLQNGDIEADIELTANDVVLVPEMDVFYIYGEVQRPGRYRLERNMTIMQALSVASGITENGNEKGISLNRRNDDALVSIESTLGDELMPNDVIYVKGSFF